MRVRLWKASIILVLVSLVDLLVCYLPIFDIYIKQFINVTAYNENLIINDYHSLIKYGMVYMIVFVFFVNYVMGKDRIYILIRYEDKKRYYRDNVKKVFIIALIFTLIHELMSVLFCLIMGNVDILICHGWILAQLLQIIMCLLFFVFVYIICTVISMITSYGTAQIITVLLFAVLYYSYTILIEPQWFFMQDLEMMKNFCDRSYSYGDCVLAIIRWLAILILGYLILIEFSDRRDCLESEKG